MIVLKKSVSVDAFFYFTNNMNHTIYAFSIQKYTEQICHLKILRADTNDLHILRMQGYSIYLCTSMIASPSILKDILKPEEVV